jgi:hypothetical protein
MPLFLTGRHVRPYGRVVFGPIVAALMFAGPVRAATTVPASSIGSFTNTIGVQTHLGNVSSSPYGNVATVESALAYVGIKHVGTASVPAPLFRRCKHFTMRWALHSMP